MTITLLFHDAMVLDPSNLHEFARSAHRASTAAELSHFLYSDAMAGGVNHLWIGPLPGVTVGALGTVAGRPASAGVTPSTPADRHEHL